MLKINLDLLQNTYTWNDFGFNPVEDEDFKFTLMVTTFTNRFSSEV